MVSPILLVAGRPNQPDQLINDEFEITILI